MQLSVVIPHYNLAPQLLTRAINSIIDQWESTNSDWEIIVVDDGSDIPPTQVINNFNRQNINLYCRKHACQGAARNFGLSKARGEYILFLDADDYILPNTLQPLLDIAIHNAYDILRFKDITVYDTPAPTIKTLQQGQATRVKTIDGESFMLRHNLNDAPHTYIFRRQLALEHNILFTENVFLEDALFTAKLHHFAKTVAETNVPVYAYYQRTHSTVNRNDKQHQETLRQHHLVAIQQLAHFIQSEQHTPTDGLQHKYRLLIVDYIRRICRTLDYSQIQEQQLPLMRANNIYPLPLKARYGLRYNIFALLADNRLGLRLLCLASSFHII